MSVMAQSGDRVVPKERACLGDVSSRGGHVPRRVVEEQGEGGRAGSCKGAHRKNHPAVFTTAYFAIRPVCPRVHPASQ